MNLTLISDIMTIQDWCILDMCEPLLDLCAIFKECYHCFSILDVFNALDNLSMPFIFRLPVSVRHIRGVRSQRSDLREVLCCV